MKFIRMKEVEFKGRKFVVLETKEDFDEFEKVLDEEMKKAEKEKAVH